MKKKKREKESGSAVVQLAVAITSFSRNPVSISGTTLRPHSTGAIGVFEE